MIPEEKLRSLYFDDGKSMMEIAQLLECSAHKVTYWMDKHGIKRRSISDAVYIKNNPDGDPFKIKIIKTKEENLLMGLGIGLYWGEGNKANKTAVRLGNTDPALLRMFIKFLTDLFGVDINDLHFALQIFSDINPQVALDYWVRELGVKSSQFYRPTVTISGSIGTYRKKCLYGVVTLHYHNRKLRDILVGMLPR